MFINAYLKEHVYITSLDFQNMGDGVNGHDIKPTQKELNYYI